MRFCPPLASSALSSASFLFTRYASDIALLLMRAAIDPPELLCLDELATASLQWSRHALILEAWAEGIKRQAAGRMILLYLTCKILWDSRNPLKAYVTKACTSKEKVALEILTSS